MRPYRGRAIRRHTTARVAIMPTLLVCTAVFALPARAQGRVTGQATADATPATGRSSSVPTGVFRRRLTDSVDSLVARALLVNPALRAAQSRVREAEARVRPAGARPDPMLMIGVQNLPLSEPGFGDFMTMKMIGISQLISYPGKRAEGRRAAEYEAVAARADAEWRALQVVRDVRTAYYDVAYIDQALRVVERTRDLLVGLIRATEARYATGNVGQGDVLRARLEITDLGLDAAAMHESRRAALGRLDALLDQPTDTAFAEAVVPQRIANAAVADAPGRIRFVALTLGSRAADSPLPPLDSLQDLAVRQSPMLRAHEAMIAAQAARVQLARLERRPDINVSLQYGQRAGYSDMVTAMVTMPLPIQRSRLQDPLADAAAAELAALEAEHHVQRNEIRADVARLHADLERTRTQLALTVKSVLPQRRATLDAAVANYQAGRAEFANVLEAQAALFNAETTYVRGLSDFAKTLAELEQVVGQEILA